ncbi:MAG: desulfoferrodoxin family protein [Clostridia bacterium]
MRRNIVIKKCKECGATVDVLKDCTCKDCGIKCCNAQMEVLVPNTVDASVEKHIPTYEIIEDEIFVKVNHVMEKEHYIQWIMLVTQDTKHMVTLYPEQNAECRFKYIKGSTIYAYCNKHELWATDVK